MKSLQKHIQKRIYKAAIAIEDGDCEDALYQVISCIEPTAEREYNGKGGKSSFVSLIRDNYEMLGYAFCGNDNAMHMLTAQVPESFIINGEKTFNQTHLSYLERPEGYKGSGILIPFELLMYYYVRCGYSHKAGPDPLIQWLEDDRASVGGSWSVEYRDIPTDGIIDDKYHVPYAPHVKALSPKSYTHMESHIKLPRIIPNILVALIVTSPTYKNFYIDKKIPKITLMSKILPPFDINNLWGRRADLITYCKDMLAYSKVPPRELPHRRR